MGNKILSYHLGKAILGKLYFKTSSSESNYRAFRVFKIKDIKILDIELERKDSLYIKNIKESFNPFLSFNKKVKVYFPQFYAEVEILEPISLREELKNFRNFSCNFFINCVY